MAIKRVVDTGFWNDDKVVEQFSPEDKLFMLYLLTNPHSTLLGIYEINKKTMAFELGYSVETICTLLERFENKYEMIKYSSDTKEIAIKNYLRYSVIKGGKPVEDCLIRDINQVKDKSLLTYIFNNLINYNNINETINNIINKYSNEYIYGNGDTSTYRPRIVEKVEKNTFFEEEFENLWQVYPNKQGKKNALVKYIKARKDGTSYEEVVNGLKKYLVYCHQNKDWYKPKNGETWFSKQSWNDELTIKTNDTKSLANLGMLDFSKFE